MAVVPAAGRADDGLPPPLVVTIEAPRDIAAWTAAGSGSRIDAADIARTRPAHASELFARVPSVWISRGDGQESLIAIRSPVLTGPGACGAFQILEDGIPIRPAGFCNVNELFEVDFAQAAAVEVARGPASSQYGANALHGAINVVSPRPGPQPWTLGLEAGPDDTATGRLSSGIDALAARRPGRRHQRLSRRRRRPASRSSASATRPSLAAGRSALRLAASNLNQETAGFIIGKDAYRKAGLRRDNVNPEAYRDASSARAVTAPGAPCSAKTPRCRSRPTRAGRRWIFCSTSCPASPPRPTASAAPVCWWTCESRCRAASTGRPGWPVEYARGFLQRGPGPAARPPVQPSCRPPDRPACITTSRSRSRMAALWQSLDLPLDAAGDWHLLASLRGEYLRYDYDNRALDGNTRDDGTPCGFGGCLYNRPADREDDFANLAGRLGLRYGDPYTGQWHGAWSSGFRPPQVTELYRLQRGQTTADLDSERLQGVELGYQRAWADAAHQPDRIWHAQDAFHLHRRRWLERQRWPHQALWPGNRGHLAAGAAPRAASFRQPGAPSLCL